MTTHTVLPPRSTRRHDVVLLAITAVTLGLVLWVIAPALEPPPDVDRITIENPHPWPAQVEVNQPDDDGWLGLGSVDSHHEQSFHSVVDQGDVWIVRFAYAGRHTELSVTRAQLADDGWHITVPDDFAHQLDDADQPQAPAA